MVVARRVMMGGGGAFTVPAGQEPYLVSAAPYGIGTDIQWPMAIYGNGKTYIGIIQGTADANDVGVAAWDHATETFIGPQAIHDQLNDGSSTIPDTHNQPAVSLLSDGRIIVAYCGHASTTMRIKVSNSAWDITAGFSPPISFTSSKAMTYPQLAVLDSGRIYIRYRGVTGGVATLCQRYSDDAGGTWSSELGLFSDSTSNLYSAMACDGSRIDHILIPRAGDYAPGFGLYHFYLEGGTYKKTDGSTIAVGDPSFPLISSDLTAVFPAGSYRFPRGIVYDSGPVIAWDSVQANPVLLGESRWSGSAWTHTTITTSSPLYAGTTSVGGGKHAWDDADTFLTAKIIGISPLDAGGSVEMFRFRRVAGTWDSGQQITNGEQDNTYSPITVVDRASDLAFLWPYGDQAPSDGDPFSMGLQGIGA